MLVTLLIFTTAVTATLILSSMLRVFLARGVQMLREKERGMMLQHELQRLDVKTESPRAPEREILYNVSAHPSSASYIMLMGPSGCFCKRVQMIGCLYIRIGCL